MWKANGKYTTRRNIFGQQLLSIPGKCLENLVIERLNYFLETIGQIPSLQYGFTAGKCRADAIKTVLEFVEHSRKLGLSVSWHWT